MKKYAPWILLIIPIYFAITVCCAPSLHPIYTEDDIIYDPALIGTWLGEDDEILAIRQHDALDNAYLMTYTDSDGDIGEFDARLVDIEGYTFLDVYPIPNEQSEDDHSQYLLIPTHGNVMVTQIEPDFIFVVMDEEWLADYLEDNPDALKHEYANYDPSDQGRLIVTASTEDLQAFLIEHIGTEGAYGDPVTYSRLDDTDEDSISDE